MLVPLLLQTLQVRPPDRPQPVSIALVVDAGTAAAARPALDAWIAAHAARGVGTTQVVCDGGGAQELRAALARLRVEARVEGAVCAGDLPVPMLRGAQHLTSAFKMDEERHARDESPVPSDAYYEDLDLVWEPLPRAEGDGLREYFELAPSSPQRLERDLWVSRIGFEGESRTAQLASFFLARAREIEAGGRPLRQAASFEGHGYVSESLDAWAARRELWRDALPRLHGGGAAQSGRWRAYHHQGGRDQLQRFLRELADPGLDLCLVHAHGDVSRQLMLGEPEAATVDARREALKRGLRARVRRAVERGETAAAAQARVAADAQVPVGWLADAFEPAIVQADEAADAARELDTAEIRALRPQAKLALLDECFNGAFQQQDDIATAWLSGGATRAVVANSVNVLQDLAGEEHLGLLGDGEWIGRWHRRSPYLESQCLGDGTFGFASERSGPPVDPWGDASWSDENLARVKGPAVPACAREVALWMRARRGSVPPDELRATLVGDAAPAVRLQALAALARTRSADFAGALELALRDGNELLRRKAAELMAERGETEHIRPLALAALRDPSPRVAFDAREGLRWFDPRLVKAELADLGRLLGERAAVEGTAQELEQFVREAERAFDDDLAALADPAHDARKLVQSVRNFRLYRIHRAFPLLLALAQDPARPVEARVAAVEALGWHVYDPEWARAAEALERLAADAAAPRELARASVKTAGRLRAGPNCPLTP